MFILTQPSLYWEVPDVCFISDMFGEFLQKCQWSSFWSLMFLGGHSEIIATAKKQTINIHEEFAPRTTEVLD